MHNERITMVCKKATPKKKGAIEALKKPNGYSSIECLKIMEAE